MISDEIQEIKNNVFNYLSYRDRSCYELKEKLLKKGFQEDNINKVISLFKERGYLDDEKFAVKWVECRVKNKPRGRNMLKKELLSKGIDNNIINNVLDNRLDRKTEVDIGVKLAVKWLKSHDQDIMKLKRYLYYKGFSGQLIYIILSNLNIIDEG